jgi:hypothetical protein
MPTAAPCLLTMASPACMGRSNLAWMPWLAHKERKGRMGERQCSAVQESRRRPWSR